LLRFAWQTGDGLDALLPWIFRRVCMQSLFYLIIVGIVAAGILTLLGVY